MEGELKSNFSKAGSDFRCDSLASFRQFCGQFLMKVLVETLKEATMPTTLSSWNPQPGKREGLGGIFDQAGPCPARERLVQVRKSDHSVFQRDGGYFFNSLSWCQGSQKQIPHFFSRFQRPNSENSVGPLVSGNILCAQARKGLVGFGSFPARRSKQ